MSLKSTATSTGVRLPARMARVRPTARIRLAKAPAMPIPRHQARLLQIARRARPPLARWADASRRAAAGRAAEAVCSPMLSSIRLHSSDRRRVARRGFVELGKAHPPSLHAGLKGRVFHGQSLGPLGVLTLQKAQHVFRGEAIIVVKGGYLGRRAHARHSRRLLRLRRIHDFTVPNGTPSFPANSPWLKPLT